MLAFVDADGDGTFAAAIETEGHFAWLYIVFCNILIITII